MSRNGTGIFAVLNPILIGALRSSSAVNADFTDMGTEITNTLPLNGTVGMNAGAQAKAAVGTSIAPGFAFGADTNTGFYRKAPDMMAWVCANQEALYNDTDGKFWATGAVDIAGAFNFAGAYSGSNDTAAIEALTGTGLLRRTGTNAWSLDDGTHAIPIIFDGNTFVLTANIMRDLQVPYACTVTGATLLADAAGSCVVDIRKCTYSQYDAGSTHPVSGDSICASAKPTLSSALSYTDSTLTGWTTTIAAGDCLRFIITSSSTIKRLALFLKVKRYT